MQRPPLELRRLAHASLVSGCLTLGLLASACVDSSKDPQPNPPPPGALPITPGAWSARPAKVEVFEAFDPDFPAAPVVWDPPAETKVLWVEPNQIALVTTAALGSYALEAASAQQPDVTGAAPIQIVDFGFSTKLAQGFFGLASMTPFGDIAVSKWLNPAPTGNIFVAYFNPDTAENVVRVFSPDFATLLDEIQGLGFNRIQPPQITADGLGNAYWLEQYYQPGIPPGGGARLRQITRRSANGALDVFPYAAAQFKGLELCAGTDLAADADGNLYLLLGNGNLCFICRLEGLFSGAPAAVVLGPVSAPPSQVKLAVDYRGRLLVTQLDVLSRWTPAPGGLGASIEILGQLPAPAIDLDADGGGTIYVALTQRILFLDVFGEEVYRLQDLQIVGGLSASFENILGFGVDDAGNLRVLDDPLVDDPNLGVLAARTYAIDLLED